MTHARVDRGNLSGEIAMRTFGEFFDAVYASATARGDLEQQPKMLKWVKLVSVETWSEIRSAPLDDAQFFCFAMAMANYSRERIAGISNKAFCRSSISDAHVFLQDIAAKGKEFGLVVDLSRVDIALTPTEAVAGYPRAS